MSSFFMKQMSQVVKTNPLLESDFPEKSDLEDISHYSVPTGVEVYELQGPLFFGTANILQDVLTQIAVKPKVFILRLRQVPLIDASGMRAIEELYKQCHQQNMTLVLSGVKKHMKAQLEKFGLLKQLKEENVTSHIHAALLRAQQCLL